MSQGHTCHATDCKVGVSPKMFMCRRHWFMVPKPLRAEIWHAYRPGQEIDKKPSRSYLNLARAGVIAVAEAEGIQPYTVLYDFLLGEAP